MKVVIDIPEDMYNDANILIAKDLPELRKIIANGTLCEWIPVSERLPNRNGVYNVTRRTEVGNYFTDSCYFDGADTWHDDTRVNHEREYLNDIIAWQPLPKPYKRRIDNAQDSN